MQIAVIFPNFCDLAQGCLFRDVYSGLYKFSADIYVSVDLPEVSESIVDSSKKKNFNLSMEKTGELQFRATNANKELLVCYNIPVRIRQITENNYLLDSDYNY